MTDRDRLIELLKGSREKYLNLLDFEKSLIADYLIENGVVPLPCSVGQTVYTNISMQGWYMRKNKRPYKAKVVFIGVNGVDNFMNVVFENDNMLQFNFSQIGKTVFLTEEEAEAELEKRCNDG
jgi:hypothetical protein